MLPGTTSMSEILPNGRESLRRFLAEQERADVAAPYRFGRGHWRQFRPRRWNELKKGLAPENFTMKNMRKRLERLGGIFCRYLWEGSGY